MRSRRLVFFAFLICLPSALILAVGAYLVAANVPRAIRNEPRRLTLEYREQAEDFIAHPETATYIGERKVGWRQTNRIDGVPWGVETSADGLTRIWFRASEDEWRSKEVETLRPFPYGWVFYGGGIFIALVLVALSALAVRYFVRFMKEHDDFLAATIHDLTTPLVGLRGTIGIDDAESRQLTERMLRLVANLRDYLRLGGRRRPPERKRIDLVVACAEAYRTFAADWRDVLGADVVLRRGEGAAGAVIVEADETMTVQILWNLYGNELKYAAPYGAVEVRLAAQGGFAVVEFADLGPGMTPREMRRVFDRYYRARPLGETGKGGFGIGLTTARDFARAMGGDLTVRANAPKGCVFTLRLPLARENRV